MARNLVLVGVVASLFFSASLGVASPQTPEPLMSFREASRRGPFGYADYIDFQKLKQYTTDLLEDDANLKTMKDKLRAEGKSVEITGDGAEQLLPAADLPAYRRKMAALKAREERITRELKQQQAAKQLGGGDVLASWSLFGSSGSSAKVRSKKSAAVAPAAAAAPAVLSQDQFTALEQSIKDSVKSIVQDEIKKSLKGAVTEVQEAAKVKSKGTWKPEEPILSEIAEVRRFLVPKIIR